MILQFVNAILSLIINGEYIINKKLKGDGDMTEWIVIDQFGNMIAQGFWTKEAAEQYSKNIPNASVIQKK